AGDDHTCALLTTGTVRCWGLNADGQTGTGNVVTPQLAPVTVPLGGTASAVAAGDDHTCALLTTGTVKCWGRNLDGQTGTGNVVTPQLAPVTVPLGGTAITIAAGDTHTCAILTGGAATCWGLNTNSETGTGNVVTPQLTPFTVPLGGPATAISGGRGSTCALLADGTAKCLGANSAGQTGNGNTATPQLAPITVPLTDLVSITTGENTVCATKMDGTVWCWGNNANGVTGSGNLVSPQLTPVMVPLGRPATTVTLGEDHACAALDDGTVWCWGENIDGQLGTGPNTADQLIPMTLPITGVVALPPAEPSALSVAATAADAGTTVTVSWEEPVVTVYDSPLVSYTVSAGGASTVVTADGNDIDAAARREVTLTGIDRTIAQTVTVSVTNTAGLTTSATVVAKILRSRIFVANRIASGPADYDFLFGAPGRQIITGDWDGDGSAGFGSRSGNLYTLVDERGNPFGTVGYGKPDDTTLVGDWNANGTDTLAVRRGNVYYLKNTIAPGNADIVLGYGRAADEVFVGDWNGNGQDTFAVRRGNVFFVRNSTTTGIADVVFGFGQAGDEVLVGDWDQDGIDTFAVRRGKMIFLRNDFQTGVAEQVISYGIPTDELVVGDFDGDGVDTFAVRRLEEVG
ncbi:MAG: hypothetical protein OEU32_04175, partial [Acidimicrobiia bacterium]|nr:hypothetical protein [Acidimicrobiia bacterium]